MKYYSKWCPSCESHEHYTTHTDENNTKTYLCKRCGEEVSGNSYEDEDGDDLS